MINLLFYSISMFGVSYIVGHSVVSVAVRRRLYRGVFKWVVKMMECPACLGWWLGLTCGYSNSHFGFTLPTLATRPVLLGLFTCGVNFVIGSVTGISSQLGWVQDE